MNRPAVSIVATAGPGRTPKHIAIIMDGNGRWARKRHLPRSVGHARGASVVRNLVRSCVDLGVGHLTLFAFSTENWARPADEIASLMGLFVQYLEAEMQEMQRQGVRLKVLGDQSRFPEGLQQRIAQAEQTTAQNTTIVLSLAANYGGRWDIVQAVKRWQAAHPGRAIDDLEEAELGPYLSTGDMPEPDLLIRTGGESRISNFLLWQAAYAELYFTDTLWPDFSPRELTAAVEWFQGRERRFGAV